MVEARALARRIGRYSLVTKLASGGMATVYLAQAHGELGFARLCAVKIIHPHLLDQPEFLARFLHEGKVASGIRHPNVVSVLDVGQADGTPYLVLDYVRGASLAELMVRAEQEREPPTLEVACTIVKEALEGLHAVHSAQDEEGASIGLIHRDVSHDNLLLSTDGVTYVTDLGIARARGVALTQATGLLGKAGYISPEQLAKEPLTAKVDLFAAGVVLWELLTRKRLFPDLESELPMLTGTFQLEPASVSNPRVPPALDAFIARMLARRPDDRPRSAGAAAQELARIVQSATREEISEWVRTLAEARLERLDAIVRDAKDAKTGSVPPPGPAPDLGRSGSAPDVFGGARLPSTPDASGSNRASLGAALESGAHPRTDLAPTNATLRLSTGDVGGPAVAPHATRARGAGVLFGALGVIALAAMGGVAWKVGLVGGQGASKPEATSPSAAPPAQAASSTGLTEATTPATSMAPPPAVPAPVASAPASASAASTGKGAARTPPGRPAVKGAKPPPSPSAPVVAPAPPGPTVKPDSERL